MSLVSLYIVPINRVYRFPRAAEMSEHRPGRSIKSARKKTRLISTYFFYFSNKISMQNCKKGI